jgi:hypothetical protein
VVAGDLQPDDRDLTAGVEAGQQGLGLACRQLPAHAAGGELGQQPVQPAPRLGPLRGELLAPVT